MVWRALQPRWAPTLAANPLHLGEAQLQYLRALAGPPAKPPHPGQETYEMACLPCHQPEGKGLPGVYPPLAGSEWVQGKSDALIRIVIHGLTGPIEVAGQRYGGPDSVPMPGMAGLTDQQIAEVLSYIRKDFGAGASPVPAGEVKRIRESTATRTEPWSVAELPR